MDGSAACKVSQYVGRLSREREREEGGGVLRSAAAFIWVGNKSGGGLAAKPHKKEEEEEEAVTPARSVEKRHQKRGSDCGDEFRTQNAKTALLLHGIKLMEPYSAVSTRRPRRARVGIGTN